MVNLRLVLDPNGERQGAVGRVAGFGAFGADGRCGTSILVDGPPRRHFQVREGMERSSCGGQSPP